MVSESERYKKSAALGAVGARGSKLVSWLVIFAGALVFLLPLYVMLVMAFKHLDEISLTSPWALPKNPTLDNFKEVLSTPNVDFALFFKNSLFIAVMSTTGVLITSAVVAYPFARLKFRGKDRLFLLLLSTMMLPSIVTLIPTYVLYKELHWINTFYPLWVPAWLGGGAFNIFLLRQFFMAIPRELDEAAVLDGATNARIFWGIIMPNSIPALATVGIFAFIYNWRDFLGPLIYLDAPDKQTLEVGLNTFKGFQSLQWNLLMAASVLVMVPLIVMFILGQRYFVKGIVMTGGK
ncbi:MAG TPA: carbohydrate ABC transporter permease [Fimbriimonadaceae bacterium]|nr:carbohydrate ABC transporter permease [Fimbriimonadaceae bacterium]